MKLSNVNILKRVQAVVLLFPFFSLSAFATEQKTAEAVQPISTGSLLQLTFGLLIVIVVIFMIGWLIRRISGFSVYSNSHLKIISGLHVGQKEKILLVQVSDKQILVGITPYSIRTLHELPNNIENKNETDSDSMSFSERLRKAIRKEPEIK